MAIAIPKLHTENFQKIRDDLINIIPNYSKEWTSRNPSDPGIAIIELFSWLADTTLYRIDRIPVEAHLAFLRLVSGHSLKDICGYIDDTGSLVEGFLSFSQEQFSAFAEELKSSNANDDKYLGALLACQAEIELKYSNNNITPNELLDMKLSAQEYIESRYRAVTEDDFNKLIMESTESPFLPKGSGERVSRAILQYGSLDDSSITVPRIYLVSDYVYTYTDTSIDAELTYTDYFFTINEPPPLPDLTGTVKGYLKPRRLVGTPLNIQMALFTEIDIYTEVVFSSMETVAGALLKIREEIKTFLDPVTGGDKGSGWPFQKPVTVYELSEIIEKMPGVERVSFMKIVPADDAFYATYANTKPDHSDFIEIEQLVRLSKIKIKASGL